MDEASHGFESGSFSIIGGKVQTIKQNDSTYSWHEMKVVTGKKTKAIKIDNEVYYKVYSNPDEGSK